MFIRYLSFSFLIVFFTACSKEQMVTEEAPKDNPAIAESSVNLQLNQQVKWHDFTIEFMQLAGDSRCPKGVQCAWAGNAQGVFLVTGKSSAETLALNTHGGDEYPKSSVINGYEIKLLDIKPYPATNIKIDPNQYLAHLSIKKSEKSKPDRVIIDVRTEKEYQAGHYPNAINLNFETIDNTILTLELSKDTEIYVYCRSGRRSGLAKTMLEQQGFTNVINGINQKELHNALDTLETM